MENQNDDNNRKAIEHAINDLRLVLAAPSKSVTQTNVIEGGFVHRNHKNTKALRFYHQVEVFVAWNPLPSEQYYDPNTKNKIANIVAEELEESNK